MYTIYNTYHWNNIFICPTQVDMTIKGYLFNHVDMKCDIIKWMGNIYHISILNTHLQWFAQWYKYTWHQLNIKVTSLVSKNFNLFEKVKWKILFQ